MAGRIDAWKDVRGIDCTNRKNKESSNGPKITPMNPNNDRPMTTPKIVMSG